MSHRFQINLRGLMDLLSNHLYSGPEVFLRELLQNGVDAIRARAKLDPEHAGELTLEVVSRRDQPATLIFTDNGVGLTEAEVHQFLATIGESSKRALEGQGPTDYIGQFGIGLLSCLMVSEEIVVISRSARENSPGVEWRGRPDGTYSLKVLTQEIPTGTQVFLTCKPGQEEYFTAEKLCELARHYGGLLPYPIRVLAGKGATCVNPDGVPWRQEFRSAAERTKSLLEYGRQMFGIKFLDAVPLRSEAGQVDGVAFVLPYSPSLAAKRTHRVYLKSMLLSENADNLLPDWAFFVKAVVNANDLRPTASRESFFEDDRLETARETLGDTLRGWLMTLAKQQPDRLERFLELHHQAIRSLAADDDEFYQLFMPWLRFETSQGPMTLTEYLELHAEIRFVPTVDQFRQIARVASAQGACIINGGYNNDATLLSRYPQLFPEVDAHAVDPSDFVQTFEDLTPEEERSAEQFLTLAERALKPFRCRAELRRFEPTDVPALFTTSEEGRFLRSVEQTQELASPLFSGILDSMKQRHRAAPPPSQLCFNYANPLVQRLITVEQTPLVTRSAEMLYVQALLLGHHPLSAKEMRLLNEGLLSLIDAGLKHAP